MSESVRSLKSSIAFFASILVSCGLMVWGAFNAWTNVLAYRAYEATVTAGEAVAAAGEGANTPMNWRLATLLIVLTAATPFLIGLTILIKATGKKRVKS